MGSDNEFESEDPQLLQLDSRGHLPAKQFLQSSIAREVIARRKKAGWTVEQLARKAKVRVDVLRKLERGESSPSVAAVDRIDRAFKAAKV